MSTSFKLITLNQKRIFLNHQNFNSSSNPFFFKKIKDSISHDFFEYKLPSNNYILTCNESIVSKFIEKKIHTIFNQYNILFYSFLEIYIPLFLFNASTKEFSNSFLDFFKNLLISTFLIERKHTLFTSSFFYWFGWFDVYQNALCITIFINQPIDDSCDSEVRKLFYSWCKDYFKTSIHKIVFRLSFSHNPSVWNKNSFSLGIEQRYDKWALMYLRQRFQNNKDELLAYLFMLDANLKTKYCVFYSLFDAYSRHSFEIFESIDHLFHFYQNIGIFFKTFTNIPDMLTDFFFNDTKQLFTFQKTKQDPIFYHIWRHPDFEDLILFHWYSRKSFIFDCAFDSVEFISSLIYDIYHLNFFGDYFHKFFDYGKISSKQFLMELRPPNLFTPVALPDYGYSRSETFSFPCLAISIDDVYSDIIKYRKENEFMYYSMLKKGYLISEFGIYQSRPENVVKIFHLFDKKKKAENESFIRRHFTISQKFIDRCNSSYYI